jgi:peptide/nickel transport system substrate-binding protein
VLDRFDGFWGPKEPWARHVRKEIANDAARVAQLKAGQLDLITRVPATDVASLKRDPKLSVQTIDTVYVFNVELDMREKALNTTAKDGSALPANPFRDVRVREAIDLAIDRKALAEVAMEGLGVPVNQMVTPSIFGFNKALGPRRHDPAAARKLLADAGYPNGFKTQFSFTQDRFRATGRSAPASRRCWRGSASMCKPMRSRRLSSSRPAPAASSHSRCRAGAR